MNRRRKAGEEAVEFQLTPMIDMTFLLLIFFMVTSKLSNEETKKEIRLPQASTAIVPDIPAGRDVINLDEKGRFFVGNEEMTKEQLGIYLRERFKFAPPLKIMIRADARAPAKKIKEIMALGGEAGAAQFIFATYKE